MKKILLLSSLCFVAGLSADENSVTEEIQNIENVQAEQSAIVLDLSFTPEEPSDAWRTITEQTQALITRIKNLKENPEAESFDVAAATLELSKTICEISKDSNASCECNLYITDDLTTVSESMASQDNQLKIRFDIARKNSDNPATWNQVITIAEAFSDQMSNATEYQFDIVANHVNLLREIVKADNRESLEEGISISLNSDFGVEPNEESN